MEALELRHVCQAYGKKQVLDDISLTVHAGEFVSIIGPSGAGKTTLLRLCNGMLQPASGQVWAGPTRLDGLKGRQKRQAQQQIGMIFQDFCLVEEMSCLQNVLNGALARVSFWRALSGRFPRAERQRAVEALADVGLNELAAAPVRTLSGGQKQRVAIARTLVQQASLILADEPVASLDTQTAQQVLALLRRLQQRRGLTVLMNSHNVDQARTWSDRIVGLQAGRVFFAGPPDAWDEARLAALYGRDRHEA